MLAQRVISVCALQMVCGTMFENLPSLERRDDALKRCIDNLTELNFGPKEYVLYSHWNGNISTIFAFSSKYTMQVYNSKLKRGRLVLNLFKRFTAYVIVANAANFDEQLIVMESMLRWNARAKFIIALQGRASEEIWRKLAGFYVVNVVVLQTDDLQLFTYFPYKYESLRKPDLHAQALGPCSDFDVTMGNLSLIKVPKQWRNTTIVVAYMPLHPYILDPENGEGIEIEIVGLMSGFMKYDVHFSTIKYADWGVYFPKNQTYSGPVGAVQRHEADFVIGHFHLREEERVIDFDTTFSYMDDDICWIVPIALIRSHWQNIMNIFDYNTWWLTIGSLFLSYVAWQFFNWGSPYILPEAYRYYRNPLCSMEVPFLNFLGLPIMHEPKSWATRFLFLVIFTFCFILVTGWKSYLIVSLTHDTPGYQVQTLKDIINAGLSFGIYNELVDLNCAEGTAEGDFVCQHADRHLCDASHACLDRVAFKRDLCTIATKRILRYQSPQHYRTESGREMLYIFKQCLAKDYTVQYYARGHPLFERSNNLLIWLRTSGFVDNLDKRLDQKIELSFQQYMKGRSKFEISVLQLTNLQGMFLLLLGGLLGSTVVFFLELLLYRKRHLVQEYQARLYHFLWGIFTSSVE